MRQTTLDFLEDITHTALVSMRCRSTGRGHSRFGRFQTSRRATSCEVRGQEIQDRQCERTSDYSLKDEGKLATLSASRQPGLSTTAAGCSRLPGLSMSPGG